MGKSIMALKQDWPRKKGMGVRLNKARGNLGNCISAEMSMAAYLSIQVTCYSKNDYNSKNSSSFYSTVSGTVFSSLHRLICLILTRTIWNEYIMEVFPFLQVQLAPIHPVRRIGENILHLLSLFRHEPLSDTLKEIITEEWGSKRSI